MDLEWIHKKNSTKSNPSFFPTIRDTSPQYRNPDLGIECQNIERRTTAGFSDIEEERSRERAEKKP